MSLRGLIALLLTVGVLGLGWQQRERLHGWIAPAAAIVTPAIGGAGQDAPTRASVPTARLGGLRKCVKGQQVSYTNGECPRGHREQAVGAGGVTVLPATPVAKPAEAGSAPSSLHQALDLTRDDKLRDRIMERAVNGSR